MALYVFSDAHLGSSDSDDSQKLSKIKELFEIVKEDGERLIILGDLFDFWFEYKNAIPKEHQAMLNMLFELKQHGVPINYVSGNHDFWMGDFFEKEMGIVIHRDFLNIEYNLKQIHLIHGDGLAKSDWGYRILKKILRNPLNIWLYRKLPPDWAIPLAKFVSGSSRKHTSKRYFDASIPHKFEKEYELYAQSKLKAGFDIVVIAHLHKPVFKRFGEGTYINTGDFIEHFSYLRIEGGTAQLSRV